MLRQSHPAVTHSQTRRWRMFLLLVLVAFSSALDTSQVSAHTVAGSSASSTARSTPLQEVRSNAHRLIIAMNGERYEAAKAFASGRVVHELMYNEPLSDISCYATTRGDADRTRYHGSLPYGCTLSDFGGYYFAVGFKRVDGRWIGFEEHDLGFEGTQHATPRQRVRSAAVNLVHALNQGSYRLAAAYASPKVVKQLRGQRYRVSGCYPTDGPYDESRYNGPQPYGCNLYIPPCCQTGVGFKHLDRGWTAVKVVPVAD